MTTNIAENKRAHCRVGINGFGRIGRLALRAAMQSSRSHALKFVHINDPSGDVETMAHLLNFDSVHGRFRHNTYADGDSLIIDDQHIRYSQNNEIDATDWSGCDIVLEASGVFKHVERAEFGRGCKPPFISSR